MLLLSGDCSCLRWPGHRRHYLGHCVLFCCFYSEQDLGVDVLASLVFANDLDSAVSSSEVCKHCLTQ